MIAGAAHQVVQSRTFAAEDKREVAAEIEQVVVGRTALIETDNPNILAFQLLKRTNQVDDPCDAQVLRCASAGLHGDRAQGCGTPFREDDAVHAGSIGDTQQGAKILGVFDAIESEYQPCGAGLYRNKEIFDGQRFLRTYNCNYALMRRRSGELCELLPGFLLDSYAGLAARSNETDKAVVVAFTGNQDMIKTASTGLEGLLDGMEAVENFHESSLDCR